MYIYVYIYMYICIYMYCVNIELGKSWRVEKSSVWPLDGFARPQTQKREAAFARAVGMPWKNPSACAAW